MKQKQLKCKCGKNAIVKICLHNIDNAYCKNCAEKLAKDNNMLEMPIE